MEKVIASLLVGAALAGCCTDCCAAEKQAENMQRVCTFVKEAGHYFIATAEGSQPHVRPFGTIHIFEGRLYVQTGRSKKVGQQLLANGKVELCAMKGDEWIRITGTLVEDPRREAKASMLDAYPSLKSMYSPDDANTMVLYFKDAKAVISSFKHAPEELAF